MRNKELSKKLFTTIQSTLREIWEDLISWEDENNSRFSINYPFDKSHQLTYNELFSPAYPYPPDHYPDILNAIPKFIEQSYLGIKGYNELKKLVEKQFDPIDHPYVNHETWKKAKWFFDRVHKVYPDLVDQFIKQHQSLVEKHSQVIRIHDVSVNELTSLLKRMRGDKLEHFLGSYPKQISRFELQKIKYLRNRFEKFDEKKHSPIEDRELIKERLENDYFNASSVLAGQTIVGFLLGFESAGFINDIINTIYWKKYHRDIKDYISYQRSFQSQFLALPIITTKKIYGAKRHNHLPYELFLTWEIGQGQFSTQNILSNTDWWPIEIKKSKGYHYSKLILEMIGYHFYNLTQEYNKYIKNYGDAVNYTSSDNLNLESMLIDNYKKLLSEEQYKSYELSSFLKYLPYNIQEKYLNILSHTVQTCFEHNLKPKTLFPKVIDVHRKAIHLNDPHIHFERYKIYWNQKRYGKLEQVLSPLYKSILDGNPIMKKDHIQLLIKRNFTTKKSNEILLPQDQVNFPVNKSCPKLIIVEFFYDLYVNIYGKEKGMSRRMAQLLRDNFFELFKTGMTKEDLKNNIQKNFTKTSNKLFLTPKIAKK